MRVAGTAVRCADCGRVVPAGLAIRVFDAVSDRADCYCPADRRRRVVALYGAEVVALLEANGRAALLGLPEPRR